MSGPFRNGSDRRQCDGPADSKWDLFRARRPVLARLLLGMGRVSLGAAKVLGSLAVIALTVMILMGVFFCLGWIVGLAIPGDHYNDETILLGLVTFVVMALFLWTSWEVGK